MSGESPGRGGPSGGESPGSRPTLKPSFEASFSQTPTTAKGSVVTFDPAKRPGDEGFASGLACGLNMLERKRREISRAKSLLKSNISTCSRLNSQARPKRKAEIQRQQRELRDLEAELAVLSEGVGAMQERFSNMDRFSLQEKERRETRGTAKAVAGDTSSAREEAGAVPRSSASGESLLVGGQQGGRSQCQSGASSPVSSPKSASRGMSGMLKEIRAVESPEHLRADLMIFSAEEIEAIDPEEAVPRKKKGKKKENQQGRFVFIPDSSESGVEEATAGKMASFGVRVFTYAMQTPGSASLRGGSPCPSGLSIFDEVSEGQRESGEERVGGKSVQQNEEEGARPGLEGPKTTPTSAGSTGICLKPPTLQFKPQDAQGPEPPADAPGPVSGTPSVGKNIKPIGAGEGGSVGPGPSVAEGNYAAALKSAIKSRGLQDKGGSRSSEGPPRRGRVYPSDPGKRRNVVRLQWKGEGPSHSTAAVVDKILDMGFGAEHLNCFVHNTVFHEYTISFVRPQELDEFWALYRRGAKEKFFPGFEAMAVTRPSVVEVNIILENESIPPADLKVWLSDMVR
ncbi:hypothetical protein XELAEV_18003019mg [Xenopus laevis]|uniref:Zinc finger CCHC domain-containing protein n=1 Tax=Xenopus laevis TaxID=8355 RepID=A0A974BPU7_XENLA|nr:hypothetical protein XELAEV_18003019mg [Xenopus laevis]